MDRLNAVLSDRAYWDHIRKIEMLEKSRPFCRHTFGHMLSVARITYILMLEERGFEEWVRRNQFASHATGKEVVYTAGLLHDIGRWEEYRTGECHATSSSRYAKALMAKHGYSSQEANTVARAIETHRSCYAADTVLGTYLQRADQLSRLCFRCRSRHLCKKAHAMETEKGLLY